MSTKTKAGEQLDLIDIQSKDAKAFTALITPYKEAVTERLNAGKVEVGLKQKLLAKIRNSDLKPLKDGVIKFRCEGQMITVTPRDELIQVNKIKEKKAGKAPKTK